MEKVVETLLNSQACDSRKIEDTVYLALPSSCISESYTEVKLK